jgi:uncharacterized protein (DUF433 family)
MLVRQTWSKLAHRETGSFLEVRMSSYVDRNARGILIVAGSRVSVGSVVHAFWAGETPETICQAYPSLSLEQVYGAIAYYLAHRQDIDSELAAQEAQVTGLRESARVRNADLRSRLADARAARP